MPPSAALSMFRNKPRGSYSSSTIPDDHSSLPSFHASPQNPNFDEPSSSRANKNSILGYKITSLSEHSPDESAAFRMTPSPSFSDELHQHRSSSATSENPGLSASAGSASLTTKAHNFVFSLQPPKKFTPSLAPNYSPVESPHTWNAPVYGEGSNLKNISTSSLSVADDAVSHKSGSSRLGKGKFNLRNPLSLLARRRASQNQLSKVEDEGVKVNALGVPSLSHDYDPRIRGKIVHDFSIPKARRLNSYNGVSSPETSPGIDSRPSTQSNRWGSENASAFGWLAGQAPQSPVHSPLFKEHFDEDKQPLQPHNTSYLHTLTRFPIAHTPDDPPKLPAFAKSLPLDIFGDFEQTLKDAIPTSIDSNVPPDKYVVPSQPSPSEPPVSNSLPSPAASSISTPSADKQPSPFHDFLRPLEDLPKHMTSTSSRFSFQLTGMGSEAQERLLEEKHKQHAALNILHAEDREDMDSEGSRYSDTDLDNDNGLEEKIPGVNADSDEEVEDGHREQSLDSFHFTPIPAVMSPSSVNLPDPQRTPRDGEGQIIGLANTTVSPDLNPVPRGLALNSKLLQQMPWFGGIGIKSLESPTSPSWTGIVQELPLQHEDPQEDVDDLYFDDGKIEGLNDVTDGESFDEDLFDDETGRIHNIPAQNARKLDFSRQQKFVQPSEQKPFPRWTNGVSTTNVAQGSTSSLSPDADPSEISTCGDDELQEVGESDDILHSGLTEDNLAYQNALVSAANEAVAQGRFNRGLTMSQDSEDHSSESQVSKVQLASVSYTDLIGRFPDDVGAEEERDDFQFDDSLEDDPMIAEANAEVLENDDEGFYGQEFGFYARAHGKGNNEMVNGGYFGPRGVEGIHRSHSAKANFQEPSLTPITERSEWSHRNSVASLHTLGLPQSAHAIQSPGIAQLLDLDSPSFEDEMSLSALMKLRRDAWGGSQTSLNSIGGSKTGSSPLAQLPLNDSFMSQSASLENGPLVSKDLPRRSYESAGIFSEELEEEKTCQSSNATETQPTPRRRLSDAAPQTTMQDPAPQGHSLSRSLHTLEKPAQSHSRASSGAESVSYIKDPEGSGRWLLERRRTGEDGQLELVEREYLAGARI